MPRSRLRLNSPAASAEPVEPPETSACARPVGDGAAPPGRSRRPGSCGPRTRGRPPWRSTPARRSARRRRRRLRPRRPGRTAAPGYPRGRASAAPAATSAGPRSAPLASTATVTIAWRDQSSLLGHRDHLAALVAPARRADAVRQPRAVALRARVDRSARSPCAASGAWWCASGTASALGRPCRRRLSGVAGADRDPKRRRVGARSCSSASLAQRGSGSRS